MCVMAASIASQVEMRSTQPGSVAADACESLNDYNFASLIENLMQNCLLYST